MVYDCAGGIRMLRLSIATMVTLSGVLVMVTPSETLRDGEVFQVRTLKIGGADYSYRVFAPKGWSKRKKWPIILFLHGAGERGSDNLAQTRVGIGPAILRQDSFPFVVVLPQCPRSRWWSEPEMQAMALNALDRTSRELNGDPTRTYLTGLSMGGYGSWTMATNNPARFAALAVVCGGIVPPPGLNIPEATRPSTAGDPYAAAAAKIRRTPVWIFHGGADPVVPVSESEKMVDAFKKRGVRARFTKYVGVGHNSWDKAYAEPELFPWMLTHKKASRGKG